MNSFWRWLSGVDARRIMVVSLLLTAMVFTAVIGRDFGCRPTSGRHVSPDGNTAMRPKTAANTLATEEILKETSRLTNSPFNSVLLDELIAKAQFEREAARKAEAERLAREKAEAERLAREKAEAERLAREKAEAERLAREKAEAERLAREKAEAERLAREKVVLPVVVTAVTNAPDRFFELIYRGNMVRTDGIMVAFVENRTAGQTDVVVPGAQVANVNMEIKEFNTAQLKVQLKDGTVRVLNVGVPEKFKEVPRGQ